VGLVRRHLAAFALIMMSLHAAVSPLGALRACLATGHTHAGGEHECPHHQPQAVSMEGHDHHAHMGHTAPAPGPSSEPTLTCGCADDAFGMLLGSAADLPVIISVRPVDRRTPGSSDPRTVGPSNPSNIPSPPPRS
jgi:hypothetical protein